MNKIRVHETDIYRYRHSRLLHILSPWCLCICMRKVFSVWQSLLLGRYLDLLSGVVVGEMELPTTVLRVPGKPEREKTLLFVFLCISK